MLNKYIFPNWKQFKNWSLPSKLTFYGTLAGIIFGSFSVYTYYAGTNSNEDKSSLLLNVSIELAETIEEVRELLPNNIAYKKCISDSQLHNYFEKHDECLKTIKQSSKEASIKLKKAISKFQPLVSPEDYANLMGAYKKIDFMIYEIENNTFVSGYWKVKGCSGTIDIKCGDEVNSLTEKFFEQNKGCILSIETYSGFGERMKTNDDIISSVKESTISKDRIKCFIIPGSYSTIKKYFHDMNNQLVKNYILSTNELKNMVKNIISES